MEYGLSQVYATQFGFSHVCATQNKCSHVKIKTLMYSHVYATQYKFSHVPVPPLAISYQISEAKFFPLFLFFFLFTSNVPILKFRKVTIRILI